MADEGHEQPMHASDPGSVHDTSSAGTSARGLIVDDTNVTSTGKSYGVGTMGGQYREHTDQGTYYSPATGESLEHFDYPTAKGMHHHEKLTGPNGVYRERDVYMAEDGSRYVHRVFVDKNTGTMEERRYKVSGPQDRRGSSGSG